MRRWFGRGEPVLSEAGPADAAALATLHVKSFQRGWTETEFERLLLDRNVMVDQAVSGRALSGFIMSRRASDEAEILSVAVASAWRRRGLAGRLLTRHLRKLSGVGVQRVFLEVDERNVAARRLYRSARFREVGRRSGYYCHGPTDHGAALVLRCDLA